MLIDATLYLAATVIAVPLFRRLGLGAVLGYLAAGIVLGPSVLGLISNYERILEVSEFGVVLLLFVIGLELQPIRLWSLRMPIVGFGGVQVVVTTLVIGFVASRWLPPTTALIIGFALSMSSTAFVLQMLGERKEMGTEQGSTSFAILLFQDIAIIPFLAVLPLLGIAGKPTSQTAMAIGIGKAALAIAIIIGLGRYIVRPVFRFLADAKVPEVFTAAALLIVAGTSLAMESVGLSMSLGAFLAGVLLANSEYRHEIQADIEPFKGLLLGLFFIAVGMSADIDIVVRQPLLVLTLTGGLLLIKMLVLYLMARAGGLRPDGSRALAVALSQGGEFAFVLFGIALEHGMMTAELEQLLVVVVTLSMVCTAPLYALQAKFQTSEAVPPFETIDSEEVDVIIAGFGTFGQIFGRLLTVKKIPFTVLERNWQHVDFVRKFGNRVYYGDASRLDVLRAARADKARFFVLSIAKSEESLRVAATVRNNFPNLRIFACAQDRTHAIQLMEIGITDIVRRSFGSSLELTAKLLQATGETETEAQRDIQRFRQVDQSTLLKQFALAQDPQQLIQSARDSAIELQQLFDADRDK